jgi:hypothetical protein
MKDVQSVIVKGAAICIDGEKIDRKQLVATGFADDFCQLLITGHLDDLRTKPLFDSDGYLTKQAKETLAWVCGSRKIRNRILGETKDFVFSDLAYAITGDEKFRDDAFRKKTIYNFVLAH